MEYKRYSPLSIDGLHKSIACFYDHEQQCFDLVRSGYRPYGTKYPGRLTSRKRIDEAAITQVNKFHARPNPDEVRNW